jgi:hypothetical protein
MYLLLLPEDPTGKYLDDFDLKYTLLTRPDSMNFTGANIVSNPIANFSNWVGPPVSAGDPGVQLSVGAGIPPNGFVQVAQMNSVREDLLFGTYRALLKITSVPGTCTSFFWVSICPLFSRCAVNSGC